MGKDGRPPSYSDAELVEAVETLTERGERDRLEGGVRPETIADYLDVGADRVDRKCRLLVDDGELAQVWGACPDTFLARHSYLPADHPDAQPPEH